MEPILTVKQEQLDKKTILEKLQRAKAFTSEVKTVDDNARTLIVKISSINPDRSNDIVDPKGADLTNYKKNPVVLLSHNYQSLPIAKCIDIEIQKDCILATVLFPDAGIYDVADTVFEMAKGGFINGWSIGFIPTEYTERKDDNGWGYTFTKWQLLEFSAVSVPDNQDALTIMRSKGINPEVLTSLSDKKDEKQLEKAQEAYETLEKVELKEAEIVDETKEIEGGEIKDLPAALEKIKTLEGELVGLKSARSITKEDEKLLKHAAELLTKFFGTEDVTPQATPGARNDAMEEKVKDKEEVTEKGAEQTNSLLVSLSKSLKNIDKEAGLALRLAKVARSRQQDAKSEGERS